VSTEDDQWPPPVPGSDDEPPKQILIEGSVATGCFVGAILFLITFLALMLIVLQIVPHRPRWGMPVGFSVAFVVATAPCTLSYSNSGGARRVGIVLGTFLAASLIAGAFVEFFTLP
jgi:hypothetical protein